MFFHVQVGGSLHNQDERMLVLYQVIVLTYSEETLLYHELAEEAYPQEEQCQPRQNNGIQMYTPSRYQSDESLYDDSNTGMSAFVSTLVMQFYQPKNSHCLALSTTMSLLCITPTVMQVRP